MLPRNMENKACTHLTGQVVGANIQGVPTPLDFEILACGHF